MWVAHNINNSSQNSWLTISRQGKIRHNPHSSVALSTCDGIRGVVFDGHDTYYIENELNGPDRKHFLIRWVELRSGSLNASVNICYMISVLFQTLRFETRSQVRVWGRNQSNPRRDALRFDRVQSNYASEFAFCWLSQFVLIFSWRVSPNSTSDRRIIFKFVDHTTQTGDRATLNWCWSLTIKFLNRSTKTSRKFINTAKTLQTS